MEYLIARLLDCWIVGVLGLPHPPLHYSITPLLQAFFS
jgi:hypothetical protein